MPNPNITEGCCNARLKDARGFCANTPHNPTHPTNHRCKFHGGMSIGGTKSPHAKTAALKHGLYAQMLRATFDAEGQKLWDSLERNTSLENEIVLQRARVYKFQKQLEGGETVIYGAMQDDGRRKEWKVEDLLDRAIARLESMAATQQRMHPEAGISGSMELKVTIDMGTTAGVDEDVPDLDADGKESDPEFPAEQPKITEEPPKNDNPLAELEDE